MPYHHAGEKHLTKHYLWLAIALAVSGGTAMAKEKPTPEAAAQMHCTTGGRCGQVARLWVLGSAISNSRTLGSTKVTREVCTREKFGDSESAEATKGESDAPWWVPLRSGVVRDLRPAHERAQLPLFAMPKSVQWSLLCVCRSPTRHF